MFLACAAKSNATYRAFDAATRDAAESGTREVPLHLRNAPTDLAKDMGHSKGYRYAHNEEGAYAAGEKYFPKGMEHRRYYHPVDRGLEARIAEKLTQFRARTRKA